MGKLKILHTSDWHLGKKLFRASRMEEQQLFLDWLFLLIKQDEYDLLLICGDIFDTPSPPAHAQECYYNFLKKVSTETTCAVYIIAGNHDSGRFLEAPLPFLRPANIEIVGRIKPDLSEHYHKIERNGVQLGLFLLPHFKSYELAQLCQGIQQSEGPDSILTCLEIVQNKMHEIITASGAHFSVLMAHHLFGSYTYAGSELMLGLTGIESIPTHLFESTFNYLALGHIHKTQIAAKEPLAIYPGPPIPMHFGEDQNKVVSCIEVIRKGEKISSTQQWVPVPLFRPIRTVKGHKDNFLSLFSTAAIEMDGQHPPLPPFMELKVEGGQIDTFIMREIESMARARNIQILKHTLNMPSEAEVAQSIDGPLRKDVHDQPGLDEMFKIFYRKKYPDQALPETLLNTFHEILEEWAPLEQAQDGLPEHTIEKSINRELSDAN